MSSPRFRLTETTADVGLLVWGRTMKELFENSAAGLFRIAASTRGVGMDVERRIRVRGADGPERLVAWLSEWLYLFDSEGFIGRRFHVEKTGGGTVTGTGWGDIYDPGRHSLRTEIKGVTYHGLEISVREKGFRARLIFDV
jgi:SHS2 domain-containing protein